MYTYTKMVEITIDEKEFIEECKEWDIEPPKTEEEMRETIISYFEEWTDKDLWELAYGHKKPRLFIKDYYENVYAGKRKEIKK